MDFIIATDWTEPKNDDNEVNLKIAEEEETPKLDWTNNEPIDDWNKENTPPKKPTPLLDYLCQRYKCSLTELQVLFQRLDTRREILIHLRTKTHLQTMHLRPAVKNFSVYCNDITTQSASDVYAMGGYLDIKVGV